VIAVVVAGACRRPAFDRGEDRLAHGPDHRPTMSRAIDRADAVYRDPRFWELVEAMPLVWLRSPEGPWVNGSDLAARLRPVRPAAQQFRIGLVGWTQYVPVFGEIWHALRGGGVAATAACANRDPAIPERCGVITVSLMFTDDTAESLTNTIGHETVHTVGDGAGPCGCEGAKKARFVDTPVPGDALTAWLASYAIGDLAGCFAENDHDPRRSVACFDAMLNRGSCNRPIVECCGRETGDAENALLVELRKQPAVAARCATIQCPANPSCESP
jgi:hypothetical protein